jgi:hypothetical protein
MSSPDPKVSFTLLDGQRDDQLDESQDSNGFPADVVWNRDNITGIVTSNDNGNFSQNNQLPPRDGIHIYQQASNRTNNNYAGDFIQSAPALHHSMSHTIKPDTYDGSQCFEQYLSRFEDCSELACWAANTRVLILSASLRGPARTYYMTLPVAERRDYSTLVSR